MSPAKSATGQRGRPPKAGKKAVAAADPFASSPEVEVLADDDEDGDEPEASIPPKLLTRLLHGFFRKEGTRLSKDANDAVAAYIDTFVREAIARSAEERRGTFLEVEDLEKIAPQLLLDL